MLSPGLISITHLEIRLGLNTFHNQIFNQLVCAGFYNSVSSIVHKLTRYLLKFVITQNPTELLIILCSPNCMLPRVSLKTKVKSKEYVNLTVRHSLVGLTICNK